MTGKRLNHFLLFLYGLAREALLAGTLNHNRLCEAKQSAGRLNIADPIETALHIKSGDLA